MNIFPAGMHTAEYSRYLVEHEGDCLTVWATLSCIPETKGAPFMTVRGASWAARVEVQAAFEALGEVLARCAAPGLVPESDTRPGGEVADQLGGTIAVCDTHAPHEPGTVDRISELEEAAVRSETGVTAE